MIILLNAINLSILNKLNILNKLDENYFKKWCHRNKVP